jgi:hypothetical protein
MLSSSIKKSMCVLAASCALAGAFVAGTAYAADSRLDEADAFVTKAVALLNAAQDPANPKLYGGHRQKAVDLLTQAQKEIKAAKQAADNPPAKPPKPPGKPPHPHKPAPKLH